MSSEFETIIGLEIHAQLKTKSKMFCGCDNFAHDLPPNVNVCPVCMGFPGVLPVPNRQAIEWTLMLGLALQSQLPETFNFERKNYFYPDLPKAYQISSATNPPVRGGFLKFTGQAEAEETVRLHHIHLEEDAGKLVHDSQGHSLVDLNRAGTPLLEIVTEPDLRSGADAKAFVQTLRSLLRSLDISDANMEQGNLRCDANISVRESGSKKLGTKVEVKNINSFKMLEKAINFEAERQIELISQGQKIKQETRGWDDNSGKTLSQRSKEEAHDYRYFPEPDIPALSTKKSDPDYFDLDRIQALIPELPAQKKQRLIVEYGLGQHEATMLATDPELFRYFEATLSHIDFLAENSGKLKNCSRRLANWIFTELVGRMNKDGTDISRIKIEPENMAELMISLQEEKISGKMAKDIFGEMYDTGRSAFFIIEEGGLRQLGAEADILKIVEEVITENPAVVADYRAGKEKALGFLVGKVMQKTKGSVNPAITSRLLKEELTSRK